jgi:hypothetical protein
VLTSSLTLVQIFFFLQLPTALGPQLRNVYRHGAPKVCTTKFEDFKYCMSLKSVDEEERRKMWIRRRAGWWAARRVGGSSEDVWDVRR